MSTSGRDVSAEDGRLGTCACGTSLERCKVCGHPRCYACDAYDPEWNECDNLARDYA